MKKHILAMSMISVLAISTTTAQSNAPTVWKIDPAGSKVEFITYGKSGVNAHFNRFHGTVSADRNNLSTLKVQFEIDANSLNAGFRTPIYKGKKGLNVAQYPKMTFHSNKVDQISAQRYKLHGVLNMHGISKPVTWDMNLDPAKLHQPQFILSVNTDIDRRQWGMNDFENMIQPNIRLNVQAKLIANK